MGFGWCYDSSGSKCSGKAQAGTRNLRDTMDALVPALGDLGIYNCRPSSGGGSALSLHGEGRAWDCAIGPDEVILGNTTALFFVDAAQMLGIQRVIWGFGPGKPAKEWDARAGERLWEPYSGPAHDDHIHVELCWEAARRLTVKQVEDAYDKYWPEEDDMFSDKDRENLDALVAFVGDDLGTGKTLFDLLLERVDGVMVDGIKQIRKEIAALDVPRKP